MAAPVKSIRFPPALAALVEAEAARSGRGFSEVVLADVARARGGFEPEAAPVARPEAPKPPKGLEGAPRPAPAPRQEAARAALAEAERKAAPLGRGGRAMEAAGVMQWDPSAKRPQYQKGLGTQGRGKRR